MASEEYTGFLTEEEIQKLFTLTERFVKAHEVIASEIAKIAARGPAPAAAKASASGATKGTKAAPAKTGEADDKKYITGYINSYRAAKKEGGFVQVEINPTDGKKYPIWVGTKYPEQVAALTEATQEGSEIKVGYVEKRGNENPNKPGTFYTDRYVASVEVIASGGAGGVVDDDEEDPF